MYSQDVTLQTQFKNFALSCALGIALALLYEVFRVIRLIAPKSKILNYFCDILFMAVCALVTFTFTVIINDGIVRGYILLGELTGFMLYMRTLGRLSGTLFRFLRRVITLIFRAVFYPFGLLFGLIHKLIEKIAKKCCKMTKKIKKIVNFLLKNRKELVYNDAVRTNSKNYVKKE